MKIIFQVFLLVSFNIVWSEAASNKNSAGSSLKSVPSEPKHALPPPLQQTAPPLIPQSQHSQSSVDFRSKTIPPHPLRTKGHLPIRNAQQKDAQSQHSDNSNSKVIPEQPLQEAPQPSRIESWILSQAHSQHSQSSKSQNSYESWAIFSENVDERQPRDNDEQLPTHAFLSYPNTTVYSNEGSFFKVDVSEYGSVVQNYSKEYEELISPLTVTKLMKWYRKMNDEQYKIQSELNKILKISRTHEFQPFLNILKCADSIGPNETVISSVYPAELRDKFTDLYDFDKTFDVKYQGDIELLLEENQSPKTNKFTYYQFYQGLLNQMKHWYNAVPAINVEFEEDIVHRMHEICGKRLSEIIDAITEIRSEKTDIENGIEQLNELVKHCEDKFKIACDTNDKKRAARVTDFHKSLNVLATKKVPFLQKVNGINEKIAKLLRLMDDLDKKRFTLFKQMENYFAKV